VSEDILDALSADATPQPMIFTNAKDSRRTLKDTSGNPQLGWELL